MSAPSSSLEERLTEYADEKSGTTPPYWTAVPRDLLRDARSTIAHYKEALRRCEERHGKA